MSVLARIDGIKQLTDVIAAMPQVDISVTHHFSEGVYAREIFIPKNTILVGKIHKHKHLNMLSQGRCRLVTTARKMDIMAPYTFESLKGEQKVIYALEDSTWTTVHATKEKDLVKIEEDCILEEYDQELIDNLVGELKCLGQ